MTTTTIEHYSCDRCRNELRMEPGLVADGWSRVELPEKIAGSAIKDLCEICSAELIRWISGGIVTELKR